MHENIKCSQKKTLESVHVFLGKILQVLSLLPEDNFRVGFLNNKNLTRGKFLPVVITLC